MLKLTISLTLIYTIQIIIKKYHNTIENTIKAFEELSRVLSKPILT